MKKVLVIFLSTILAFLVYSNVMSAATFPHTCYYNKTFTSTKISATCDADGVGIYTYTCIHCGDSYQRSEAIKATGHQWRRESYEASHPHYYYQRCSKCNKTQRESATYSGKIAGCQSCCSHSFTYTQRTITSPTCLSDGRVAYDGKCTLCGKTDSYTQTVSKTGHNWVSNGYGATHPHYSEQKCSSCGVTQTLAGTNKASGCQSCCSHSYSYTKKTLISPTCLSDGQDGYEGKCTLCGKINSYTQTVPKTGHHWVDNGYGGAHPHYLGQKCSSCGVTQTLTTTTKVSGCQSCCSHSYTYTTKTLSGATCVSDGQDGYDGTCKFCGKKDSYTKVVPKTGHHWVNNGYGVAHPHYLEQKCSSCGVTQTLTTTTKVSGCQSCCSHQFVKTEKTVTAPTCTAVGIHVEQEVCTACGIVGSSKKITVPAAGHYYESDGFDETNHPHHLSERCRNCGTMRELSSTYGGKVYGCSQCNPEVDLGLSGAAYASESSRNDIAILGYRSSDSSELEVYAWNMLGAIDFNCKVKFEVSDGTVLYGNVEKSAIEYKGSKYYRARVTWRPASTGHYTVKATIDPSNEITEKDENNNSITFEFDVVDDFYEPANDSKEGATLLEFGRANEGKIYNSHDTDWWYFDVPETSPNLCLDFGLDYLENEAVEEYDCCQLSIKLIDSSDNVLDMVVGKQPHLTRVLKAGRYYLKTETFEGYNPNEYYKLTATATPVNESLIQESTKTGGEIYGWKLKNGEKMNASEMIPVRFGEGTDGLWGEVNGENITYKELVVGTSNTKLQGAFDIWNSILAKDAGGPVFVYTTDGNVKNQIKTIANEKTAAYATCLVLLDDNGKPYLEIELNTSNMSKEALKNENNPFDIARALAMHELGHSLGLSDLYAKALDELVYQGKIIDNSNKLMFYAGNGTTMPTPIDIAGVRIVQGWASPPKNVKSSGTSGLMATSQRSVRTQYSFASYQSMNMIDLYKNAFIIVKGRVRSIYDNNDAANGFASSTVVLDTESYYKDLSGRHEVSISFLQDGNGKMPVYGNEPLRPGETCILFLKKSKDGTLFVCGGPQGRFDLEMDGANQWVRSHLNKVVKENATESTVQDNRMKLEEFEEQIRTLLNHKPEITGAPTTQPNANGWYNKDVTIRFTAKDEIAGVENVSPDVTVTTQGVNQSVKGLAINGFGNTAEINIQGINIDKTSPTISSYRISAEPLRFELTFRDEGGSQVQIRQYAWSTTDRVLPKSWTDYSGTPIAPPSDFTGTLYLFVKAADFAGNETFSCLTSCEVKANMNGDAFPFIYGDVNGDNQVTEADYNLVTDYIIGKIGSFPSQYGKLAANVDGKEGITSTDLAYIKRYILGVITKFPAQK